MEIDGWRVEVRGGGAEADGILADVWKVGWMNG